ncbi:MAG: hypothetical protein EXR99_04760 [Gemmataceae bacterium]|nr:hypothetical protein [Gemmataceae bacterium]
MDDQTLRYAMNLLSPSEAGVMESRLASDIALRHELDQIQQLLKPLSLDREAPLPSSGLGRKTIQRAKATLTRTIPMAPRLRNQSAWGSSSSLKRRDLLLAASLLILVGGILTPWLHTARAEAEKKACALNLAHYGKSLQHYSALQPSGEFPKVQAEGPHSFAGAFVSTLRQRGLLGEKHSVTCPGNTRTPASGLQADQLAALYQQEDKDAYHLHTREAAGDYAYTLGYVENGELKGLTKDSGDLRPIMADKAGVNPGKNSMNHGGKGQNTLFIGGHVSWLSARKYEGDDIFLNQDGQVRAGKHPHDHVLGPSHSRPFSNIRNDD